jgi:hypothetical protein
MLLAWDVHHSRTTWLSSLRAACLRIPPFLLTYESATADSGTHSMQRQLVLAEQAWFSGF